METKIDPSHLKLLFTFPIGKDGELRDIISINNEKYSIGKMIGDGSYGYVFEGKHVKTGQTVAIKRISRITELRKKIISEISAMMLLTVKNVNHITRYLDTAQTFEFTFIIMDFVKGTKLKNLIPSNSLSVLKQLTEGIKSIHDAGLLHRDIKPDNILITKDNKVSICDFGFSSPVFGIPLDNEYIKNILKYPRSGTSLYMDPEVYMVDDYQMVHPHSDMYSLGTTLIRVTVGLNLSGHPNYMGMKSRAQMVKAYTTYKPCLIAYLTKKEYPPMFIDIVVNLCNPEAKGRYTTAEILKFL